jgi:amino acid adenylation domain-containing protein
VQRGDRVALLGRRTADDFVHLLGIWLAGAAYVPLNHKFPAQRNREIMAAAGARGVLVGPHSAALADEVAPGSVPIASYRPLEHGETRRGDAPDGLAYLLFTSGTTGVPKGVPITFDNLAAYLSNLQSLYPLDTTDRCAQLADLSFDASIHEIASCWRAGGALCVVPPAAALMWPRYARELGMTAMLAVPSSVVLAARARLLPLGSLPDLRLVFLGAEALTLDVAKTMQAAAPRAQVVNLWGPTEATVASTHFPVDTSQPLPDVIPIGRPFPGQELQLWDGEIVQSGAQVAPGYWRNPDVTKERFVERDGQRWFRTGDLARWDERFGFCYLGRVDRQVKIRGWRIELLECETAVRTASGCDQVAVIASGDSLACFLAGPPIDVDALRAQLRRRLPDYMVPSRFEQLEALPLGASGKTDYRALEERLRS